MKLFEVNQSEVNELILSYDREVWDKNTKSLNNYRIDFDQLSDDSDWSSCENSPSKQDEFFILASKYSTNAKPIPKTNKREVLKIQQRLNFDHSNTKSDLLRIFNNN